MPSLNLTRKPKVKPPEPDVLYEALESFSDLNTYNPVHRGSRVRGREISAGWPAYWVVADALDDAELGAARRALAGPTPGETFSDDAAETPAPVRMVRAITPVSYVAALVPTKVGMLAGRNATDLDGRPRPAGHVIESFGAPTPLLRTVAIGALIPADDEAARRFPDAFEPVEA